jgi:hypothetical protein
MLVALAVPSLSHLLDGPLVTDCVYLAVSNEQAKHANIGA